MKHSKWKIINQQDVSPSKWFPVVKDDVELPDGSVIDYYKSKLDDVSMVVPITKDNEIVFVKQYKHGIGEVCLEFPAGRIENGATPKQTALSELKEETGIVVEETDLTPLIELWTEPSKSTVRVYGFLVTGVEISQEQNLEETENIEIVRIPIAELDSLIETGEVHASDTVALLLFARDKFLDIFSK